MRKFNLTQNYEQNSTKQSSEEYHKYNVDLPGVWGLKSLTEIGLSDSISQKMHGNISHYNV